MTQFDTVKKVVQGQQMSIGDIAEETGIKEPNIRRILGEGTKKGVFTRVEKGIYTIQIGDKTKAIIQVGDSLKTIKKLKDKNYKFDMVFLDIPYKTIAVTGGNRGVKYSLISPVEFKEFLQDLKEVITENTHIYHMFSNAPSGWKQMKVYNEKLIEEGFIKIASGGWQKLFKNGKPCSNMRGDIMKREGLELYSLSGKNPGEVKMNFESVRPRTASEKCINMLSQLVKQSSKIGDMILDPFAGTGTTGEASLKLLRNVFLLEKSEERVEKEILPRLRKLV